MTSLIKGALAKATKFTVDWVTIRYCTVVGNRLRKYGLRHDDLYDQSFDLDLQEALNRLPREVVDARNQRIKRAMDLSMKHEYLPKELQAVQTPFRGYLYDMLELVKAERKEREALGATPLYERTIP
ncbi:cytochrome b-c1 complex subunit 7-1, mitochondrial [Cryptomeria japonica]|uniref:cytochrome b-c1 complex subunit 7-1, mitochondrial n=1 Tax=Cryptomeria japonica TaxID=3369 RepID=UPI0025AC5C07|nr:cytochrome b-c1 complex subunit 7-1, mitochondrial [Cryptomeria japonica]